MQKRDLGGTQVGSDLVEGMEVQTEGAAKYSEEAE